MEFAFYFAAGVAVLATLRVITNSNPVHALLYLIISLLAISMTFFSLGAPFAGALEIIVYAGAIMVLFVFVVMMLNLGPAVVEQERKWLTPGIWVGPSALALVLLVELLVVLARTPSGAGIGHTTVDAKAVGISLYGPYLLVVVASVLFALGLVGLMVRRNILFVLMSLEVMMNAAALAFVVAGSRWGQPDGQVMFILVLSLAAAEASIGLAILLQLYRRFHTLDIDAASEMRG